MIASCYYSNIKIIFFYWANRKKKSQRLPRISVEMSKRGRNCPASCLKKLINWKWWKVGSRWKPEWRKAHSTASTTRLPPEEACQEILWCSKHQGEVCYQGILRTLVKMHCTSLTCTVPWSEPWSCHDALLADLILCHRLSSCPCEVHLFSLPWKKHFSDFTIIDSSAH